MEIDQLKPSSSEDQMEMMMLMDKLPDFYSAYADVSDLASADQFPGAADSPNNTSPNNAIPHFVDNPQIPTSSPFILLPSNPSFTGTNTTTHIQDHDFLSNMIPTSSRWRGSGAGHVNAFSSPSHKKNSMAAMREMIFRIAAMQPIHIDPESVKPPKRRNVKISKDPQSVAARHRRERISERIRILQRLVPGGTKMDTASMLDEAIHYVKFLKTQVQSLERAQANRPARGIGFPVAMSSGSYPPMGKPYHCQQSSQDHVQRYGDAG